MVSPLSAHGFIGWFLSFAGLLALGTVFFGQVLWFAVPVIAGKGCISGGVCGAMAAVLGLWLQPALLLAAVVVGMIAFYRRGRAVGSRLWALFPLALLLPNLPALFMLGHQWGVDLAGVFLFFPRWSLVELMPLLALGVLFCFRLEYMPGYAGSIFRTRLYDTLPTGLLYVLSCIWIGSDLLLSLGLHLGAPAGSLHMARDVLHFPFSISNGMVFAGLPPLPERPDLVVPFATAINMVFFLVLVFALVLDGSGRLRRPGALVFIETFDAPADKPLFPSGVRARD